VLAYYIKLLEYNHPTGLVFSYESAEIVGGNRSCRSLGISLQDKL